MLPLSRLLTSSASGMALLAGGMLGLGLMLAAPDAEARDSKRGYHGGTPMFAPESKESSGVTGHKQNGFGRLFAVHTDPRSGGQGLTPQNSTTEQLRALGKRMVEPREWQNLPERRSNTPTGYIFLGQFIDHDITLDVRSHLDQKADPGKIDNFRSVDLDLDNIYGEGPEASPFLYNLPYLRLGNRIKGLTGARRYDLLRTRANSSSGAKGGGAVALIGDPRNDENFGISQLQAAFITYHNSMVDRIVEKEYGKSRRKYCRSAKRCRSSQALAAKLPAEIQKEVFEKARDHVIHYYHRVIAEDFLPRIIGRERAENIWRNGRVVYFPDGFNKTDGSIEKPFIPFEFSVAAYRFGHGLVHQNYRLRSAKASDTPLFDPGKNGKARVFGFTPITSRLVIDWRYFFPIETRRVEGFNFANKLAPMLPIHLHDLTSVGITGKDEPSLASRNLMRGRSFRLPSGQQIARLILPRLQTNGALLPWQSAADDWQKLVLQPDAFSSYALGYEETPLWYYVLQESASFVRSDGGVRVASLESSDGKAGNPAYLLPSRFNKLAPYARFEAAAPTPEASAPAAAETAKKEVASKARQEMNGLGGNGNGNGNGSGANAINQMLGGGFNAPAPAPAQTRPSAPAAQPSPAAPAAAPRKAPAASPSHAAPAGQFKLSLNDIGGDTLGPVGGTLVGEVMFGLLEHYALSTGKGLNYKPEINATVTSNNELLRRKVKGKLSRRGLTATRDHGARYQMRNLIYDAGLAQPVKRKGER